MVVCLTSASKFNVKPFGGIFDVSPENGRASPNLKTAKASTTSFVRGAKGEMPHLDPGPAPTVPSGRLSRGFNHNIRQTQGKILPFDPENTHQINVPQLKPEVHQTSCSTNQMWADKFAGQPLALCPGVFVCVCVCVAAFGAQTLPPLSTKLAPPTKTGSLSKACAKE